MKWYERLVFKVIIKRLVKYLESMKSIKTTFWGIVGFLGIVATQIYYIGDADPETTFSVEAVIAGLSLIGVGWFARDNDKTSEEVGAGQEN